MTIRFIHEYQENFYSDTVRLLQLGQGVLLEMCVGSGKTLVAMMVAAQLKFNRVIVLTPLRDIRAQFKKWDSELINSQTRAPVRLPSIGILETRSKLEDYFRDTRGPRADSTPGVAVVTYNIWREAFGKRLKNEFDGNWDGTLIIVDEGHHAYTKEEKKHLGVLSWSINEARIKGAKTLQLTATAARYDGESVQLKDVNGNLDQRLTRGLLDHIKDGFAPYLQSRVIKVSTKGISDKQSIWMPARAFEKDGFQEIIKDFESNGRPLSVIRIRCQDRYSNRRILRDLKRAFRKRYKSEVRVATHTDINPFKRWKELVDAMNPKEGPPKSYQEIKEIANVIIVHQKVNEGVDLPAFSNLYLWGIPYSMPLLIQLCGRIMRLRIDFYSKQPAFEGYPESWQNMSRVVFCTSATGDVMGATEAKLMHQLGGWLHSLELGTLLSRLARIDDGLRGKRPRKNKPETQEVESALTPAKALDYFQASIAWLEEFSDPLNQELSTDNRKKMLIQLSMDQAIVEGGGDLSTEELEKQFRELAEAQVILETGDLSVATGIKGEEDWDQATMEAIELDRLRFVEQVRYTKDSTTQWIIRGSLQSHYTNLGRITGVLSSAGDAFEKAQEFMVLEGRCPGFDSSLRKDRVPGEIFGFDRYTNHPWKRALVEQFLTSLTLSEAVGRARQHWAAFDGISSPQQQRVGYTNFRIDPRFKKNPLITYYPGVLWIDPRYDWVNRIDFEALSKLGTWTKRVSKATHYGENIKILKLVSEYIDLNGVESIINLIRLDELDSLQETKAA